MSQHMQGMWAGECSQQPWLGMCLPRHPQKLSWQRFEQSPMRLASWSSSRTTQVVLHCPCHHKTCCICALRI